ncbi:type VI secretion system-associated FHA domain protein TagH [Pseudomonas sp. LRF_L74]|uniref:type VI secretion system-associated FHA domain protein TagH n=1 Tax=Pseudomonas sp. LRF_L74 TaxID=3369422 RepID=UPI003F616CFA
MPLRLVITTYHKLTPGQRPEIELDRGELSIGRGPDNDWVLPDPGRLVSSQHCIVQFRDGTYYVTDTSTNGIIMERSGLRLRRGNSEPLSDGEVLKLGEYDILVQITVSAGVPMGVPSGTPDPFSDFDALMARQANPGAAIASIPSAAHFQSGSPFDTKPDLFDFLAAPASTPAAIPDHLPAERHDFRPPQPLTPRANPVQEAVPQSSQPANAIPDDWDPFADLAAPVQPVAVPVPPAAPVPPAESLPSFDLGVADSLDFDIEQVEIVATFPAPEAVPAVAPPQVARPAAATGTGAEGELLEAFLRGAGLAHLRLDREAVVAQMETVGRSYRLMVEGLIDVLRARASLKGEFRMAQTTIQPVENNPLKFAPNVDEALLLLLRHDNRAFMAPDQAVAEGFDDLRAHQLAVMAGVQGAIKHLLRRFEPSVLEARLSKPSGLAALLPSARQAQYWELFTELFATISREAEDDFQDLFGREFGRAYEEHIARLRGR